MKQVEEVTACVVDYGTFLSVAEKLAETMQRVYYHSPFQTEYQDVRNCVKGGGLDLVQRLDEFLDPDVLDTIDLFVFPDIGFGGLQRHLRSIGKAVWGHMGADELELFRAKFLDVLDEVGLPKVHSEKIKGLTALAAYLKENEKKWVKINRFRGNMETWHHRSYPYSERKLDSLAVTFGGAKDQVVFIVQDEIESDMECGYDGWCVDGEFPESSFQGYEAKNELYLGSVISQADLPDEIKDVNRAMAPILKGYGYRCWWATEIRVKDGVPYFIDPTPRMAGQTEEHQIETCTNFADVIWSGANGDLVKPQFKWKFAAEATLHYDLESDDDAVSEEWKILDVPTEVAKWVKLYSYCKIDGLYHMPLEGTDEVGVVLGVGDSTEGALENLQDHLEALKELPVHANVAGFASLLKSIEEAEKEGITFGGKIPKPESIVKKMDL